MRYPSLLFIIALIFTIFGLSGCSSNVPNQSAVEQAIQTTLAAPLKAGLFEILSIKKTNGHPDGENNYVVEAEIKMKFKNNFVDLKTSALQQSRGIDQTIDTAFEYDLIKEKLGNFKAGEEKTYKFNYMLVKTEKGWIVQEGQGWGGI